MSYFQPKHHKRPKRTVQTAVFLQRIAGQYDWMIWRVIGLSNASQTFHGEPFSVGGQAPILEATNLIIMIIT